MKPSLLLLCLLCGCSGQIRWVEDRRPETPIERSNVQYMVLSILTNTPHTMSGHDQDWDDAIGKAYTVATETWCEPRLYEWESDNFFYKGRAYTGRMKTSR